MNTRDSLTADGRDLRVDFFLGIANWFIFLDHIPGDAVNRITLRNFGFSGAADFFIFISGYAAAVFYAGMMAERGFVVGATRLFKRVWHLYAAYVVLFVIYIVAIGDVASRYEAPDLIYEFNIAGLVEQPLRTLAHGLLLQSKVLNLDVLPLYIVLMAGFAPVLWAMMRKPDLTMAGSLLVYIAARHFGWSVPTFPDGNWYFNPFCWQLLFVFGGWLALGGIEKCSVLVRLPGLQGLGIAYLIFALVMTMAGHFPQLEDAFPGWLFDTFNPNDKTNLAPYRLLHFLVLLFFVTRWVPGNSPMLKWSVFDPVVICGRQSLAVFCVGVFLSFAGGFVLMLSSGSLRAQIVVSVLGIAILTLVAYYISWSKQQSKPLPLLAAQVSNSVEK